VTTRGKNSGLRDLLLHQAVRFFRLQGSREKGARGFAVGLAFNFFPTFGTGAILAGFLAKLVGGNVVAGILGGSILAVFWPFLFYLNVRVGSWFIRPPIVMDDYGDVTPQTIGALVWGKTFAVGSAINSAVAVTVAYFAFLALYERIRPGALRFLRRKLRERRRARGTGET
jgi:uncharacterized protein (DUF2062 family)